jgi:hypothetical protein
MSKIRKIGALAVIIGGVLIFTFDGGNNMALSKHLFFTIIFGGMIIFIFTACEGGNNMALSKSKNLVAIEKHLKKFGVSGDELAVLSAISPQDFHLDVYWIKPNEYRDYIVLMTGGISGMPLKTPSKKYSPYIELCIVLPKDWDLAGDNWQKPENYWPIKLLQDLGPYPHQNDTWFGFGHTVNTGKVDFTSAIILKSPTLPEKFQKIKYGWKKIELFTVVPLYPEELEFKLQHSSDELLDLFNENGITDIVDIHRKNVCKK